MTLEYQIEPRETFLQVDVWGTFDTDRAKELFPELIKASREHGISKSLIDCSRMSGKIPVSDRFEFASFMAQLITQPLRIAVVASKRHVLRDKFMETVARNRGVLLKVATEREEATQWLDSQPAIGLDSGKAAAGA
jgi:hypothetical protein